MFDLIFILQYQTVADIFSKQAAKDFNRLASQ